MKRNQRRKWMAVSLATAVAFTGIAGNAGVSSNVLAQEATEAFAIDATNLIASNGGVFDGWGTSLCWFGNRIGSSEQTTKEAAELLINEETGLGLDIIRFNIGGGDDPTHTHITRTDSKMPGYWGSYDAATDTFTYDYTKDGNQRNVLLKMLEQNPNLTLEAFSNSAPYFMTESGCTSGTAQEDAMTDNLKADKYDDFADYMAKVVKYYKENYGVNFTSIEPMNENGWSISRNGAKQEGCTFTRGESQSKMLVEMDKALTNNGLADVILAGFDESSAGESVTALKAMTDEAKAVIERVDTHTYVNSLENSLKNRVSEMGLDLWMSESDGSDVAGSDAGEMSAGLGFAKRINQNLYKLQPSAWIMWQAIGSYCDKETYEGNKDPDSLNQSELDTNGFWGVSYADMNEEKVVLTKKYYVYGQYTRYINPGDYMIVGDANTAIAYNDEKDELKIVVSNFKNEAVEKAYAFTGFDVTEGQVEVIRTSGDMSTGENWASVTDEVITADSNGFTATLKPNSVTTFIVKNAKAEMPKPSISPVPTIEPTVAPSEAPSAAPSIVPSVAPQQTLTPSQTPVEETTGVAKVTAVKASKVKKNTATLSWKKVEGAKYKVAYSTNKKKLTKITDGSAKAVAGTKVINATKNKITLKGLKKGKTYYIKVCAYMKKGDVTTYGKYSAVKKCKLKK